MRRLISALLAATVLVFSAAEARAAATFCDQVALTTDPTFEGRVRQALISACLSVANEAITSPTIQLHLKRVQLCTQVLAAPDSFKTIFTFAVSTDAAVGTDATTGGPLCGAATTTIATQAAAVTDAHITAAIANAANAFFSFP